LLTGINGLHHRFRCGTSLCRREPSNRSEGSQQAVEKVSGKHETRREAAKTVPCPGATLSHLSHFSTPYHACRSFFNSLSSEKALMSLCIVRHACIGEHSRGGISN